MSERESKIMQVAIRALYDRQEEAIERLSDRCKANPCNDKTARLLAIATRRADETHALLVRLSP